MIFFTSNHLKTLDWIKKKSKEAELLSSVSFFLLELEIFRQNEFYFLPYSTTIPIFLQLFLA